MSDEQVTLRYEVLETVITNIKTGLKKISSSNLSYTIDETTVDLNIFDNYKDQMKNEIVPIVNNFQTNLYQALISIGKSVDEYRVMDEQLSFIVKNEARDNNAKQKLKKTI